MKPKFVLFVNIWIFVSDKSWTSGRPEGWQALDWFRHWRHKSDEICRSFGRAQIWVGTVSIWSLL